MFLLRGSYRLLAAVCFLLGVNVFTIYVLNQTGGLSPGKMTAHAPNMCIQAPPVEERPSFLESNLLAFIVVFAFSSIYWLLIVDDTC